MTQEDKPSTLERVFGYNRSDDAPDTRSRPTEKVFVVGLGRFGSAVCATLLDLGVETLAVDVDVAIIDKLADILPHLRVADATDPATLKQLGIANFDASVVAIGSGIESSVLTVAALNEAGAPNIWAKATTPEHGRILSLVGADHVVYPEIQMGERIGRVVSGSVIDFFQIDENFVIAEIETPRFLTGRRLDQSGLRSTFELSAVCIKPKGGHYTYATSATVPPSGSFIVVAGTPEAVKNLTDRARS